MADDDDTPRPRWVEETNKDNPAMRVWISGDPVVDDDHIYVCEELEVVAIGSRHIPLEDVHELGLRLLEGEDLLKRAKRGPGRWR